MFLDEFQQRWSLNSLSLKLAVTLIRRYLGTENVSFVVLVDELVKVSQQQASEASALHSLAAYKSVLSEIGYVLDTERRFVAVVSTLDRVFLDQSLTPSGRVIKWAPLQPIDGGELVSSLPAEHEVQKLYDESVAFRTLVGDANGHPLTLEYLFRLCIEGQWFRNRSEVLAEKQYDWWLRLLKHKVGNSGRIRVRPEIHHVLPALLGLEKNLDDKLTDSHSKTFSQLISEGYYINTSSDSSTSIVPTMTIIMLARFAERKDHIGVAELVAQRINDMLLLEPTFGPKCYEYFHQQWEAMRRTLLRHTDDAGRLTESLRNTITLDEVYPGSMHHPDFDFEARRFMLDDTLPVKAVQNNWTTKGHMDLTLNRVHMFGASNKGFDLDILVQLASSPNEAHHLVENRYSTPETSQPKAIKLQEVSQKREKCFREQLVGRQVTLIFAGFRPVVKAFEDILKKAKLSEQEVQSDDDDPAEDPSMMSDEEKMSYDVEPSSDNDTEEQSAAAACHLARDVLVLSKACLTKLYTPTLALRPYFATAKQSLHC